MWKPVILQSTQWILLLIIMLFFREVTSWYMWKLQFKIYLSLSHLKLFLKLLPLHDPTACATNIATICTLLLLISDMFLLQRLPLFLQLITTNTPAAFNIKLYYSSFYDYMYHRHNYHHFFSFSLFMPPPTKDLGFKGHRGQFLKWQDLHVAFPLRFISQEPQEMGFLFSLFYETS